MMGYHLLYRDHSDSSWKTSNLKNSFGFILCFLCCCTFYYLPFNTSKQVQSMAGYVLCPTVSYLLSFQIYFIVFVCTPSQCMC